MKAVYYTNKGKVRTENQDCIAVNKVIQSDMNNFEFVENINDIIAVADGVGGAPAGKDASKIVLQTIMDNENLSLEEKLEKSILSLEEIEKKYPKKRGLATTLSGISIKNNMVFNCGDSRVYKKKGGNLWQLTYDHVNEETNTLTSAVTSTTKINDIQLKKIKIKKGDIFLICTDGFWKEFKIEEIEELFFTGDIKESAENIIKKLSNKNLKDNISFIILKI